MMGAGALPNHYLQVLLVSDIQYEDAG